ncbi:MAG TPA: hypothetical protein VK655_12375 [Solirubrobacteraceae bacterium]|nr:hypothetical protein [Solirubrobacteraceae bacterium]
MASAFARATTAAVAAVCVAVVPLALVTGGVLAVTAGAEPDPPVLVERPCSAKNHTAASRQTPTSAI